MKLSEEMKEHSNYLSNGRCCDKSISQTLKIEYISKVEQLEKENEELLKAFIKFQNHICDQCNNHEYCNVIDCNYFENIIIIEKTSGKKWEDIK